MVAQTRERLLDDHHAVSEVLKQLLTALDNKDVETSYARLDLLWARLAVHIRAEHLHLFPAVTARAPQLSEAIVENLRDDHDFFMRELAQAIRTLREANDLAAVTDTVREIEKRLATHNEIEETQIYRWSSTILTEPEQLELLAKINGELENRPPRFSEEAWANTL
ncbi:MAG TPA: hemerythrin domain-containing protein [Pyrinomonadaceae bacterium]|nr:hemerythrin domain-containing protein [Pyrinomonadaceae bacterium]